MPMIATVLRRLCGLTSHGSSRLPPRRSGPDCLSAPLWAQRPERLHLKTPTSQRFRTIGLRWVVSSHSAGTHEARRGEFKLG